MMSNAIGVRDLNVPTNSANALRHIDAPKGARPNGTLAHEHVGKLVDEHARLAKGLQRLADQHPESAARILKYQQAVNLSTHDADGPEMGLFKAMINGTIPRLSEFSEEDLVLLAATRNLELAAQHVHQYAAKMSIEPKPVLTEVKFADDATAAAQAAQIRKDLDSIARSNESLVDQLGKQHSGLGHASRGLSYRVMRHDGLNDSARMLVMTIFRDEFTKYLNGTPV